MLAASDPMLAQLLVAARVTWPGVELADDSFLPYLAARLPGDVAIGDSLRTLCVRDLWLACAVSQGDAAALRAFEDCLRDLEPALAHLDGGSALALDVRHAVRERVLPASAGGQAKIADYRGRGDLRGWLRVVAVREALQLLRARRRETPIVDGDHTLAARLDERAPVETMTEAERLAYRDAFASALATLSPRERNLLRQQYLYGASVDELAALYGVHRATAARWVARIRELVLRRTRRQLGEVLRLSGDELDSVMGRLANHLDYSLRQTLSLET
ncbi:MAG: putative DNA-binding regulatory protein [Deltaproteobacteria bacterium]|nr:putative DNA-binding regulatory protein [Deltaproteobacteria bacterium]